jgi:arabinogalactan oligomer/maltooligosaccharide transport system permease protein
MKNKKNNIKAKKIIIKILTYLLLTIITFVVIYPILQLVSVSLRPGNKLLSTDLSIIPEGASLDSFVKLFTERPFLRWIGNSLFVSFVVTVTGVILAAFSGYAMSRYNYLGKKITMLGLLTTQMFPATMLLLPMYIMLVRFGLINSYLGIIIIYSATALPFCIWQMKGYYDTIPTSLEEAAFIDGCSHFSAFYRVILPLAGPALVITALFSFMTAWSEYVVAAQILQETDLWTLPLGLKSFEDNMTSEWGLYAAASLIVSIPVIILFFVLSKWLVSGLTLGSIKG